MQLDWAQLAFNTVFVALIGYLISRLTKHQDRSDERWEKVIAKLEHLNERHDVTDRVLSTFTQSPYDSAQVAKGLQPYPVILNERRT